MKYRFSKCSLSLVFSCLLNKNFLKLFYTRCLLIVQGFVFQVESILMVPLESCHGPFCIHAISSDFLNLVFHNFIHLSIYLLHLVVRLYFWRSGECEVSLHSHYFGVHSDTVVILGQMICQNYLYSCVQWKKITLNYITKKMNMQWMRFFNF